MSASDIAPAEPAAEPSESVESPAGVEGKPPPKPRTPDDDFEDVLKKAGGLKYKAGGKEKAIGSVADLRRMLSRIDGTDSAASEALKEKNAAAERKSRIDGLAKMKPLERIEALKSMGIDPALARQAFEEEILANYEKEKQQAGMSDRERQLQRQLEERDNELSTHRQQQERAAAEQKEQAFMAETTQILQHLEQTAMAGFEKAGITGADRQLVTAILPAVAEAMDRAKRLGLEMDPADIAEVATKERAKLSDDWNSARPLEDLHDSLERIEVDDPANPGKKTTKLKLLMLHVAAKIRAQVQGGAPPAQRVAPQQAKPAQTEAEKMAFWRRR